MPTSRKSHSNSILRLRARVTERNRFDAALHREAMARQDWLEDLATRVTGAPGVGNSVVSG